MRSYWSKVDPNPMVGVLIRENRDMEAHSGRRHVKTGRVGATWPQTKEYPGLTAITRI